MKNELTLDPMEAKYLKGLIETVNAINQRFHGVKELILSREGLLHPGEDVGPWQFDGARLFKQEK